LFDVVGPGLIFGIKGVANILFAAWLFTGRKKIYAEIESAAAKSGS